MSKPADDDAHIEASRAPLLDHLIELRRRLMWSLIAFFICFGVCYFFSKEIYAFLAEPVRVALKQDEGMIFTGLTEPFFTYLKVASFAALCLSFPIVAIQIWMFVAPGLYRNEQGAFLPFLFATPVLFTMGAALVYYGLLPVAIHFFLSFETAPVSGQLGIQAQLRVAEYLDLVMSLIFAFGLSFQLPVLLTLMGRVGLISSDFLKRHRRYAIVVAFVVAAVLTPPDVLSQVSLAIPLIALYEGSVWSVWLIERRRADEAKRAESAV